MRTMIADQIMNDERWHLRSTPEARLRDVVKVEQDGRYKKNLQELIRRSVAFNLDNVSLYAWSNLREGERIDAAITQLPSLAPPFDLFWAEWFVPTQSSWRMGALVMAYGLDEWQEQADKIPHHPAMKHFANAQFHWVLKMELFDRLRGLVAGPIAHLWVAVNEDGTPSGEPLVLSGFRGDDEKDDHDYRSYVMHLYVPAMAISLLSCKNVSREGLDIRPRPERRLAERRRDPYIQFKTLVVSPTMKPTEPSETSRLRQGARQSMHICRGNFATYSDDKPLFGKYSGTFWRSAHVRGSDKVGMIGKDYKVIAPKP